MASLSEASSPAVLVGEAGTEYERGRTAELASWQVEEEEAAFDD